MFQRLIPFVVAVASLPQASLAGQPASTQVIVVSGEAAPDDNGTFASFFNPVLGDAGQVAFLAFFDGTDGGESDQSGMLYQAAGGDLTQVARAGQAAVGGGDEVFAFNRVLANGVGEIAFFTFFNDAGGAFTGDAGILGYAPGEGITELARMGMPSPSGNGDLTVFGAGVSLNNAGVAGFIATFTDPTTMVNNTGAFAADGVPLVELGTDGEASPDGNGTFMRLEIPALNNGGDAAFVSSLADTTSTAGVFIRDSAGVKRTVIRQGQAAPDGNGSFGFFANAGISESGSAAFIASLSGTTGAPVDQTGIFIGDGSGPLIQVARGGQAAPDGNGTIAVISNRSPVVNDSGQTAILVGYTGTSGGQDDDIAILRGAAAGGLVQLVREGESAPDGNGKITPTEPAINSKGQVAFRGSVAGASGGAAEDLGLFFFDDEMGLMQVAREGAAFLGSTISGIDFANGLATVSEFNFTFADEVSGLNDLGQVAYRFSLADGRNGVALWSCPATNLAITDVSRAADQLTILFTGEAGVSDWLVRGSSDLASFPDDKTGASTITEPTPGNYMAVIDVSDAPDGYFVRIER